MLTTAKSIQLLDASGMNISPITDITSLYYETPSPNNSSVITRKYVYTGFPVAVNISGDVTTQIGVSTNTSGKRHPADGSLYDNGQFYKVIDRDKNEDILVSRLDTSIIPGTTLRQIEVKNYNLSEILSYYTPLDLMDASYGELVADISIINASINDVSNRIHTLRESLDASICSFNDIKDWIGNELLVLNKFYLINNYYVGDGCMALPNPNTNFSGPTNDSSLSLLVKANDASTLDGKLYEMYYNNSGAPLKVYGTYKLENNKVHITYMKDQYGNEAPYDFYNLKYNGKYAFNGDNIKNNKILTDPYESTEENMYFVSLKAGIIENNIIGYNNNILVGDNTTDTIANNVIKDNNKIELEEIQEFKSNIINVNNTINSVGNLNKLFCIDGFLINCDNNINFNNIGRVTNFYAGITLLNNNDISINAHELISGLGMCMASNVILTNNKCESTLTLQNNTIIDGCTTGFTPDASAVYLFGQNVYAKSFNTINELSLLGLNTIFAYVSGLTSKSSDAIITLNSYNH